MLLRLNQVVVEGTDSPIDWLTVVENVTWLRSNPDSDLQPIEVEETGAWCSELERIFVARDGKHRFISYLAAGRHCIPAQHKDPNWVRRNDANAD